MTDYQNMTNKTKNRENKKNDIDRPEENKRNKKLPPKFENLKGEPTK